MEVIGGADKYQAVCRECYGGLVVDKENSAPFRDETPEHALTGKLVDSGIPRKLFSSLHLWALVAEINQCEDIDQSDEGGGKWEFEVLTCAF